jgi:SAM-dependent methyltransferase
MNRSCPICSSSKKTLIYKQKFTNSGISLMKGYDIVVCKTCGFVFADKIPLQKEFDHYYAVMSKYEFNYANGAVSKDYLNHFTKIVNFLIPNIARKKAAILDIGCSTGGLLSIFKLKGYTNLLGIDPSSSCIKAVRKLYRIEASVNNIANFKTDKKFDLIILSAVLEHLVDFTQAILKIRSLLKDQGLLFIEVPDVERFALFCSPARLDKEDGRPRPRMVGGRTSFVQAPFQQFSI